MLHNELIYLKGISCRYKTNYWLITYINAFRICIFAAYAEKKRVRFAPSPTGGLHLGGVRTVLYNYLFAHQHDGQFILRIEDTDQARLCARCRRIYLNCLTWCGLEPDESPGKGRPLRTLPSKRKKRYLPRSMRKLVENGHAYYAFDTPDELEEMRARYKTDENPSPQYNQQIRKK